MSRRKPIATTTTIGEAADKSWGSNGKRQTSWNRLGFCGSSVRASSGSLLTETGGLNFDNDRMVDQAIHGSHGHHGIGKDGIPLTEGLIGSDQQTFAFVAVSDQLEEDRSFRLRLLDIAEVINDEEVKAVELFKGGRQLKLEFGLLEVLH